MGCYCTVLPSSRYSKISCRTASHWVSCAPLLEMEVQPLVRSPLLTLSKAGTLAFFSLNSLSMCSHCTRVAALCATVDTHSSVHFWRIFMVTSVIQLRIKDCLQPEHKPSLSYQGFFFFKEAAKGEPVPVVSSLWVRMIYCGVAVVISILESTQLFV